MRPSSEWIEEEECPLPEPDVHYRTTPHEGRGEGSRRRESKQLRRGIEGLRDSPRRSKPAGERRMVEQLYSVGRALKGMVAITCVPVLCDVISTLPPNCRILSWIPINPTPGT